MEKDSLDKDIQLLVIGGSAGSLDVILKTLPGLDTRLPFAILIVLHRKSSFESILSDLFAQRTSLKVQEAEEKELLKPGNIYIAPADYHVLIERDKTLSLDFSEKIHYSRPSIDVAFESAADVYGSAAAGLLLSGANADGAEGLKILRQRGGITAVQDPATAEIDFMPRQALAIHAAEYVIQADQIARYINELF